MEFSVTIIRCLVFATSLLLMPVDVVAQSKSVEFSAGLGIVELVGNGYGDSSSGLYADIQARKAVISDLELFGLDVAIVLGGWSGHESGRAHFEKSYNSERGLLAGIRLYPIFTKGAIPLSVYLGLNRQHVWSDSFTDYGMVDEPDGPEGIYEFKTDRAMNAFEFGGRLNIHAGPRTSVGFEIKLNRELLSDRPNYYRDHWRMGFSLHVSYQ